MEWHEEINTKEKAVLASLIGVGASELGYQLEEIPDVLESIARSIRGYEKDLREKGPEFIEEEIKKAKNTHSEGGSSSNPNPFAL